MKFFTPIEKFTHFGRFYGVPLYLNLEDEQCPTIAGRNIIFDYLFVLMTFFHNAVVERGAQFFAAITGQDYEPGFPIMVWEMVYDDESAETESAK